MKKPGLLFLLFPILCFIWISCGHEAEVVSQMRDRTGFKEVSSEFPGDVFITTGAEYGVRVQAPARIMKNVKTEVENGRLSVWLQGGNPLLPDGKKAIVYVTVPELSALWLTGSGNGKVANYVKNDLMVVLSGTGNLEIPRVGSFALEVRNTGTGNVHIGEAVLHYATLQVAGSGNITIDQGTADVIRIVTSGTGSVNAKRFKTRMAEVDLDGSGNAQIAVSDSLHASVSGSGNVIYEGEPQLSEQVSGSGAVKSRNPAGDKRNITP